MGKTTKTLPAFYDPAMHKIHDIVRRDSNKEN